MESSSIVIKVKFGDTLRRFNALINNHGFNFDMIMLKKIICNLFDFTPDVDFSLTYIDEDGDAVSLCDNNDLRDVAVQSLNPLRIFVRLNTEENKDYLPFQILKYGVFEILKNVPEPLHNSISKILLDLAAEAASSAVVLAELLEKVQTIYVKENKVFGDAEIENPDAKNETLQHDQSIFEDANTEIDQDYELCKNRFYGVVEPEDVFFDAQMHNDQETNAAINNTLIISNNSESKSNTKAESNGVGSAIDLSRILLWNAKEFSLRRW